MLLMSANACSNEKDANTITAITDTDSETEKIAYTLDIPDYDRGGETFYILTGEYMKEKTQTFSQTEGDGDALNTALYERNFALKERFNIEIEELTGNDVVFGTNFKKLVQSGDDSFQIGVVLDRYALGLAIEGYVVDVSKLTYIDLDKPWWYKNAAAELTIGGKLYFTFGYHDISSFDSMCMMTFNKDYISDFNLDDPYELVRSGKWTIDKMAEMCKVAQRDIDGDGEMTEADLWGASAASSAWGMNFTAVNGETYVTKDSDDYPVLNVFGNERLINICEKMFSFNNQKLYYEASESKVYVTKSVYENCVDYFIDGHSLFSANFVGYAYMLRQMEYEYGIIPFPKYEEVSAGTIYNGFSLGAFTYIVPMTNSDKLEFTSAFLEAAAYESYKAVIPVYYNTVVLVKQTRDEDSAEMLVMMNENRVMDMYQTYWLDIISPALVETNKTQNIVSSFTKYEENINDAFKKAIDAFKKLA